MKKNFFSINTWLLRFSFAFNGIIIFFKTEHNSWVYLLSTITVAIISIAKGVTKNEAIALMLVIGFVWVAELLNTAIEKLADMITLKYDTQIKTIKDLAAAAVLLSALVALATGLVIFIPKFY